MSRQMGRPYMPWQQHAADIGGEYELDELGRVVPAYREVIVTVMRQSGKSTLTFSVVVHRCVAWNRLPQRVIYTAQDGAAARAKVFNDAVPMFEGSAVLSKLLGGQDGSKAVYRGVGPFEGVNWRTGSTIRMIGSSEEAGHGMTDTGLAVVDESFADVDDRREQALGPSMATVFDAQTWNVSTAGTAASVFLRRKIEAGRAAAEAGRTSGIAYIEYSIPPDADVDDPETWWSFMPALGWTITEPVVAHARETMSDGDWRRSYGNQWTEVDDRSIPAGVWSARESVSARPEGALRYAVEVHPDRDQACIVAAGANDVAELVEHRRGVRWVEDELPARMAEVQRRHGGVVRVDVGGPAATLIAPLEAAGVPVEKLETRDVVRACGAFYDGLADGQVTIRPDEAGKLSDAAAAVQRRRVGEAWAWSRRHVSVDVTPIMALSLALLPGTPAPFYMPRRLR